MCLHCREEITLGCQVEDVTSPKTSSCSRRMSKLSRSRRSSSSRSRSSGGLKYSTRYSRSLSLSSCRWVKPFPFPFPVLVGMADTWKRRVINNTLCNILETENNYFIYFLFSCLPAHTRAHLVIPRMWGDEAAWPAWAPGEADPDTAQTGDLYEMYQHSTANIYTSSAGD